MKRIDVGTRETSQIFPTVCQHFVPFSHRAAQRALGQATPPVTVREVEVA
jgi:hypothetical protein